MSSLHAECSGCTNAHRCDDTGVNLLCGISFLYAEAFLLTVALFYNLTGDTAQVGGGHEPQNEGRVDGVTLRLKRYSSGLQQ